MNGIVGGIIALGTVAFLGTVEISAQDVESIMRARERLELTEEQLEDLEDIRRETVQERTTELAEAQELRSQLDAGQIRRSDMMAFMEERRDSRQALAQQRREQIEAVLTEGQLETVQEMRRRRGRMGASLGGRPGTDGPGFAPRGRAGVRGQQRPLRGPPRASLRSSQRRGGDARPFERAPRQGRPFRGPR